MVLPSLKLQSTFVLQKRKTMAMFSSFAVMSAVRFRASLQNHPESLTMRQMQAIFTNASAEEGRDLVALAQFFSIAQPSEGSFHNPALGRRLEDALLATLDRCMFQPNMLSAQLIGRPV